MGGFYARFEDKSQLVRALEERFFAEMYERLERLADARRWRNASLTRVVRTCVEEAVSVVRERRNLIAAFLMRSVRDPEMAEGALRFRRSASERMAELLLALGPELRHPRPAVAVDLAVQFAFGLLLQLVMTGEIRARGRALSDAEIRREIERNFLGYVGAAA